MAEPYRPWETPQTPPSPEDGGGLKGRAARLVEAARDPDLRARVMEVVEPYGQVALRGALESAGVAKVDEQTGRVKVRKVGALKAALRPTRTVRKAVQGAAREVGREVKTDAREAALSRARDVLESSSPETPSFETPDAPVWTPPTGGSYSPSRPPDY